jgi:hypothetical protein
MDTQAVRKCSDCGSYHPKVFSWIDGLQRTFYFCNMKCKDHFIDVTYPAKLEEEKLNEEATNSILPQVRSVIAHKNKDGSVTFVSGNSEVHPRSDS